MLLRRRPVLLLQFSVVAYHNPAKIGSGVGSPQASTISINQRTMINITSSLFGITIPLPPLTGAVFVKRGSHSPTNLLMQLFRRSGPPVLVSPSVTLFDEVTPSPLTAVMVNLMRSLRCARTTSTSSEYSQPPHGGPVRSRTWILA